MSHLRLEKIRDIGEDVMKMEAARTPATKARRTEFMYDGCFSAYSRGNFPASSAK
jgi:hypothetical protein